MKLLDITEIHTGYLNRSQIEPSEQGSHFLVQARDVNTGILECQAAEFVRFTPKLSNRDTLLQHDDLIFMSRGARNYAALLKNPPEYTLAAASFFVIRIKTDVVNPGYLLWYLNHPRAQHHFTQHGGSGVHMPVVRKAALECLNVPVPPPETQKKIAELFQLKLDEEILTQALLQKRARLLEAACLQAAERKQI